MFVNKIALRSFRNHNRETSEFNPGINVITGPNASGKTNIVEAIYYLSLARSFRGAEEDELVGYGEDCAEIEADFGLGLVRRCSLTSGFEVWNDAVDAGRGQKRTVWLYSVCPKSR